MDTNNTRGHVQGYGGDQWTRDIPIPSKRGIIYDRNGKLAISASIETLYVRPVEIKDAEEVSFRIAEALDMDRRTCWKGLKEHGYGTFKKKVEKEDVTK